MTEPLPGEDAPGEPSPSRRALPPPDPGVLDSKLAPPPLGFPALSRRRLLDRLSRGVDATPVTLLSGPAGSGKTVLAASWLHAHRGRCVAWLSLDDGDDDPAVFWPSVFAAFGRAGVQFAELPALLPGQRPPAGWLVRLAAAVAALPERVVLIIDNADSLTSRELTGALDLLVRHAGARLRLVLCARADPLLPLHRYRLNDQLTEIRTDDLALTAEETGGLLATLGAPVPEDVAATLREQTEGWAAAVRLAAAPLTQGMSPDHLIASLVADDGSVAQYLTAEVLDRQQASVRRFLLRVSVTEQLWPDLVDRLTGRPGAARTLGSLADANAFVERVPGAPGGFRVHALFRQLLQAQLAYEDPAQYAAAHRTCATWYASAGSPSVAVEHALAADDWQLGARLMIDDLAVGRVLAHATVGSVLPADTDGTDAAVLRAAAALAANHPAGPVELTAAATAAVDRSARPELRVSAAVVCAVATAADPVAAAVQSAAELAPALVADLPEERADRRGVLAAVLAANQAAALLHTDATGAALRKAVHDALTASAATVTPWLRARSLADLALLETLAGRLRRAVELAGAYEQWADEQELPDADRAASAAVAAAWVSLERHELADGRHRLARALARRPDPTATGPLAAVLNSRLRRARGELDAADQALEQVLGTSDLPLWVREQVITEAVSLRLARHHGPAARALLGRLPGDSQRARLLAAAAAARGDAEAPPIPAAPTGPPGSTGPLPLGLTVEDAVVRGCLLADAGDIPAAVATLEHALHLAAPERLRRPFLDAPPQLRRLLRAHPGLSAAAAFLNPTATDVPTPRRPADAHSRPPSPARRPAVIGELSPRELEVLQHLAQMLSTAEIAAAMFVSVNTVRTHIRSILRKLGATRRNEAVRRARELRLL
jgi:LuxR family transcriptional regulator, maltose regulon positive regulatory protein